MKIRILLVLVAVVALGGCASTPSTVAPPAAAAIAEPASDRTALDRDMAALGLRKDMTGEEVKVVLGEPVSTAPMPSPEGEAVIWTFRHTVSAGTRSVQIGTREVPYFDPFTGASTPQLEPVYGLESSEATEEIELLMFDGRLVSWKRKFIGSTNSYK